MLLHGHGRLGASLFRIDYWLERAGYVTFRPSYPYRRTLADIAATMAPTIEALAEQTGKPVHFVTHSLGGLVARALFRRMPSELVGRTVMLGPPNGGSEWADLLFNLRAARLILGDSAVHLRTKRTMTDEELLETNGEEVGIVAGCRSLDPLLPRLLLPRPNDGKVSVEATHLVGETDHIVLPVTHTLMVYDQRVLRQVLAFLDRGQFSR